MPNHSKISSFPSTSSSSMRINCVSTAEEGNLILQGYCTNISAITLLLYSYKYFVSFPLVLNLRKLVFMMLKSDSSQADDNFCSTSWTFDVICSNFMQHTKASE